jgi:hypothetical protein
MEKTIWYIYKTINTINQKFYIGKHMVHKGSIDKNYLGSGKLLWLAIKKYGKENFIQEIIEFNNSEEENCLREQYWIKFYGLPNKKISYNLTTGGEGGISSFNTETNKWLAIEGWKKLTQEEHNARVKKMQDAIKKPEVLKVISDKSKEWHASLTKEELKEWKQKCSNGWSDEKKKEAGIRIGERNKIEKIYDRLIKKYGQEIGEIKYQEWKIRVRGTEESRKIGIENQKKTISEQKKSPFWKQYQHQKAIIQGLKVRFKRGKLDKETYEKQLETENVNLIELRKKVKEIKSD